MHIYWLHHYKENYQSFSEYVTFLVSFSVGSLGTRIQTIFDLVPRCLKQFLCYRSHSVPYAGFQVLEVVDVNLVDSILHITPQEVQWA
jgi:hypothetical protein